MAERIGIFISTPADFHFYKNAVMKLEDRGVNIRFLLRDYNETLEVADVEGYVFSKVKSNWDRIYKLPFDVLRARKYLSDFKPDLIIGFEIYAPYTAKLLRSRSFIFYDSEPRISLFLSIQMKAYLPFVDAIITPKCYLDDLGKKHLRVDSFKELAYLHPKYFKPDKSILDEMGVEENSYAVVRFNAFDAAHDIGVKGFSNEEKIKLVKELEKYVDVFISAEGEIPKKLRNYVLPVSKRKIHHVLYYAKILISETGTMSSEAAILGTPVVIIQPKVFKVGVFAELEEKYGVLFRYIKSVEAMKKAIELASDSNIKKEWRKKRENIIKEKVDITEFMVWFIENYPESLEEFRANPEMQYRFR